jgi:hypothetical protein
MAASFSYSWFYDGCKHNSKEHFHFRNWKFIGVKNYSICVSQYSAKLLPKYCRILTTLNVLFTLLLSRPLFFNLSSLFLSMSTKIHVYTMSEFKINQVQCNILLKKWNNVHGDEAWQALWLDTTSPLSLIDCVQIWIFLYSAIQPPVRRICTAVKYKYGIWIPPLFAFPYVDWITCPVFPD